MAVTRQLFELQELDNDIESTRQTLRLKTNALGNRTAVETAAAMLAAEQKTLEELKRQRRDAEGEVAGLAAKINDANKQLYSGKTSNSKELSNLQQEIKGLTAQKDQIETKTLEIIENLEASDEKVNTMTADYRQMDTDWNALQVQLTKNIELLKNTLAGLEESRKEMAGRIDAAAVALYERIRKMKKQGVARVERGICQGCRLSLSASALQKARAGHPVQCGTCGRILFIS